MAHSSVNSLDQLFDSFHKVRVLIIGDVMLDSHIWGTVERISPEAPVPVVHVRKKDFRLGGAGNVAVNVAALEAQPVLCALVGDDDHGKKVIQLMAEKQMTTDGITTSTERPTTVKTRVIAGHQHVVRVDEESDRDASAAEEAGLLEKINRLLPTCQVVIFEDYDKGVLNERIIQSTVAAARKLGIPTIVDPKKRNFTAYQHVTLFKPNLKELREGLKTEVVPTNQPQLEKAVTRLRESLQADGVMVTLSEHGVYIDYKTEKAKIAAHAREIADVSGAGDTVVSVAALCVAAGLPAASVAGLSNLAGGLVCQHVGVVPIDVQELRREAAALNALNN